MKNQYKAEYDSIKLTQQQKNTLITKMNEVDADTKVINFNRKIFTRAIAACLAIAILCTGFFLTKNTPKNSFTIIANAAEVQTLPEDAIGIFTSDDSGNAWTYEIIDDKPVFKECKSTYHLSQFEIQGANIKSVTVSSNNENCKIVANEIVEHKDFSAENYNRDKFGIGYTDIEKEGFNYKNKKPSSEIQTLKFDNLVDYIVIPDREDPEIAKILNRIDELQNYGYTDVSISNEEDKKRTDERSVLTSDYLEKTLRDASIDVTVTFTDGTTQTQVIDVDFIIQNEDDEIIFDAKYDDYTALTDKEADNSRNIVFRYAE